MLRTADVPMNDLARPAHQHEAVAVAVAEVVRSGSYLNGPRNSSFVNAFAKRIGASRCIGVANGTDALQLAIGAIIAKTCGIAKATTAEVVTVANAGGYTSTACYALGCIPVYCDIDAEDHLISVEAAVSALTDRTVAVVVTHLYGGLVDVAHLRRTMDAVGFDHVAIVEDCAQAHGLDGANGTAGSLGDIATFSFYPTKNLGAMGDGGAVLTNDETLASFVDQLRQYGWSGKYDISRAGGMNSRLDEIQAAILSIKLKDLDAETARRREIIDIYAEALPSSIRLVRCARGTVGHLAVLQSDQRDALRQHLSEHGIASDIHYPILDPDQAGWSDAPRRIAPTGLEVSRRSVSRILSIPCFPGLTNAELARVCDALGSFRRS